MRKLFIILASIGILPGAEAQNVGIGIPNPTYPLTVAPNSNGTGIVQKGGAVEIGFVTNTTTGGWLKTLSDHGLHFATNHVSGYPDPAMTIATSGNVGIGANATAPAFKLDIAGRLRIRHNAGANQTAGIWFDGNTTATRSLFGTIDDDHVGFWGNGGTGWNIAMNVENGNTGIGVSTPTARLDINGSVRLRSNSPKTGSVLTSIDVNGNTNWEAPVAFRVSGSSDGNPTIMDYPNGMDYVDPKYYFSAAADYNLGFHFNTNTSEFTVPYNGIYHFTAQVAFTEEYHSGTVRIIITQSNGYILGGTGNWRSAGFWNEVEFYQYIKGVHIPNYDGYVTLEAGQKVYMSYNRGNSFGEPVYDSISPDPRLTWFSGRLVTRL